MIVALQTLSPYAPLVFFRQSLLTALNRLLSPYYKQLQRTLSPYNLDSEQDDEEVFAEFDDEKGVVFFPPMYAQRYAAVSDCLMDERWCGKLSKVVDLGYHDMSFIKYLKDLPGVDCILGVDLEGIALRCSFDLLDCGDYGSKRENPLQIRLFQGNASDPDYRLIGCDAVVAIEMIEHMLPHDLDRLVHTIFGFIKPWVAVITTPNGDFNELFNSLETNGFRRLDHFFEWSREQFHDWCSNIVLRYPQFTVTCQGIGPGPPGTEHLGCCSQLALFVNNSYVKQQDLNLNSLAMITNVPSPHNLDELHVGFDSPFSSEFKSKGKLNCTTFQARKFSKTTQNIMAKNSFESISHTREVVGEIHNLTKMLNLNEQSTMPKQNGFTWCNFNWGENAPYWNQYFKVVKDYSYPFEEKSEECRILDLVSEEINQLIDRHYGHDSTASGKIEIPIEYLMKAVRHITKDVEKVKDLLEWNGYIVSGNFVVHSRSILDSISVRSEDFDWPERDTISELDGFEVQSIPVSDRSAFVPDTNGLHSNLLYL
ncbi:hypothetical protein O0L34_g12669 [Tuta absoluta]|nr:hypothetical protein O0L34_g12669 [Tuta absoluta]